MDWLELTIRYLGIGLLTVIILGAVGLVLLTLVMVAIKLTPRLHIGAPKSIMEMQSFSSSQIMTTKHGVTKPLDPTPRPFQQLELKWWFGLSSRNSARWFFGFMRWQNKSTGL